MALVALVAFRYSGRGKAAIGGLRAGFRRRRRPAPQPTPNGARRQAAQKCRWGKIVARGMAPRDAWRGWHPCHPTTIMA